QDRTAQGRTADRIEAVEAVPHALALTPPTGSATVDGPLPMSFTRDTNVTSVLEEPPAFTRQRPGGTFLVIKGPDRGEQVSLSGKPVTFGSAPSCDLVLSDKTVSRRHAQALLENNEVLVRDMGSTNGSFIQGSRFKEITVGL